MPVLGCSNGKYRIGTGPCVYNSKEKAERAYRGYLYKKARFESLESMPRSLQKLFLYRMDLAKEWFAEYESAVMEGSPAPGMQAWIIIRKKWGKAPRSKRWVVENELSEIGGPGSGGYGHAGRPGEVGGSSSEGLPLPKEVKAQLKNYGRFKSKSAVAALEKLPSMTKIDHVADGKAHDCDTNTYNAYKKNGESVYVGFAIEIGLGKEGFNLSRHAWNVKDGKVIEHTPFVGDTKNMQYRGLPVPKEYLHISGDKNWVAWFDNEFDALILKSKETEKESIDEIGGPGSGYYGHSGRLGKSGGSLPRIEGKRAKFLGKGKLDVTSLPPALKKIYSNWKQEKAEKIVLIFKDGNYIIVGSGEKGQVGVSLKEIQMMLKDRDKDFFDLHSVVHNHDKGEAASQADVLAFKAFMAAGFGGDYLVYTPATGQVRKVPYSSEKE